MPDRPAPLFRYDQVVVNNDGTLAREVVDALNTVISRTGGEFTNAVGGTINGVNQINTQLMAEQAARIAGDQAASGTGDGSGASNSGVFSGIVSAAAAWVVACAVTVTPGGAGGDYTIGLNPDAIIAGGLSDDQLGAVATFQGNWQIIEELTGGGTEHVLDAGTFTVTYTPPSSFELIYEGGGEIVPIPEAWSVEFTGLPSGLIAANEGAQVDIRLEIQRASGTNEITAPGLSGSMSVAWTA